MTKAKAFIFDMNGTLIDDMPWHIKIWNGIFNEYGANQTLVQSKAELYGKNSEILERIFPGKFSDAEKDALEMEKEKRYQQLYKNEMELINGLEPFLQRAFNNNISMAVGTAAIRFNVDFILDGLDIRRYFKAIVTAEDVRVSKPDPETFLQCASMMGLAPKDCIVFEDSPKGVETAANAGMECVVITTMHTPDEFTSYSNILWTIENYNDERLNTLLF